MTLREQQMPATADGGAHRPLSLAMAAQFERGRLVLVRTSDSKAKKIYDLVYLGYERLRAETSI